MLCRIIFVKLSSLHAILFTDAKGDRLKVPDKQLFWGPNIEVLIECFYFKILFEMIMLLNFKKYTKKYASIKM